jgi:RNA polymerase sigma factor (sigma-70 family)
MAARVQTDVYEVVVGARRDLPEGFAELLARLTSHDRNERASADEALTRFEQMAGSTTSTAEHTLAELVKLAKNIAGQEPTVPTVDLANGNDVSSAEPGTATILGKHEGLVQHVVSRVLSGTTPSADLIEDLLAAGRLALVEAKRDYDAEKMGQAAFSTFAFLRIQGAVVEAVADGRGFSRGAYRAAKRKAAEARAEATGPLELQTEQWIAEALEAGTAWQNLEPFTDIEWGIERDALHAAIERIPFAREREIVRMVGLEGITQRAAGARFDVDQAATSRILKSGFEMLRDLLEIGSALDEVRLPATLQLLEDSPHGEVIGLLYRDRLELAEASQSLGITAFELRARHRDALASIKNAVLNPQDRA